MSESVQASHSFEKLFFFRFGPVSDEVVQGVAYGLIGGFARRQASPATHQQEGSLREGDSLLLGQSLELAAETLIQLWECETAH